jgi:ABC-type nitrate/sulfonate/bicarbonate transport system permease component
VPTITAMFQSLWREVPTTDFWSQLGQTILVAMAGMAISACIGIVVGIVIGASDLVYRLTLGIVEFLRPIPPLVYLPFVLLVVGANMRAGIVLVVTAAVWPVLVQTAYGVRDIDPVLRDVAAAYGLTRVERMRSVVVPTILPFVASAVRIAVMMALIVTIGIELLGTGGGLGGAVHNAEQLGQYADMYSYGLVAGVLGVLISSCLLFVERRVLSWHPSYREDGLQ